MNCARGSFSAGIIDGTLRDEVEERGPEWTARGPAKRGADRVDFHAGFVGFLSLSLPRLLRPAACANLKSCAVIRAERECARAEIPSSDFGVAWQSERAA